jgi:hypothetical protein
MMSWNVHALSMASTAAAAYLLCAIFDALFAPYGLLALLAPASPWPLAGSPLGYATGLILFTLAGYVLGGIYGAAWRYWSRGGATVEQGRRPS